MNVFNWPWIAYLLFLLINYIHMYDECTLNSCSISSWMSWNDCIGVCGSQSQYRQKVFCCPKTVLDQSLENCFHACNITMNGYELNEFRPCRICKHGILLSGNNCYCDPRYKGDCCEGKFT